MAMQADGAIVPPPSVDTTTRKLSPVRPAVLHVLSSAPSLAARRHRKLSLGAVSRYLGGLSLCEARKRVLQQESNTDIGNNEKLTTATQRLISIAQGKGPDDRQILGNTTNTQDGTFFPPPASQLPKSPAHKLRTLTANADWEGATAMIKQMREVRQRNPHANNEKNKLMQLALLNQQEEVLRDGLSKIQEKKTKLQHRLLGQLPEIDVIANDGAFTTAIRESL
jgi:hypothetical protein